MHNPCIASGSNRGTGHDHVVVLSPYPMLRGDSRMAEQLLEGRLHFLCMQVIVFV